MTRDAENRKSQESGQPTAATASARLEDRKPLPSVGLVCICGKAVATIEGVARKCECGRLWLVTVMLLGVDRG